MVIPGSWGGESGVLPARLGLLCAAKGGEMEEEGTPPPSTCAHNPKIPQDLERGKKTQLQDQYAEPL